MQYQLFIIPFYAIYTLSTYIDKNNSDVIISYTGHNEADGVLKDKSSFGDVIPNSDNMDKVFTKENAITEVYTEPNEVIFIPNERDVVRNDEYGGERVNDLMESPNIKNIIKQVDKNTESPAKDIIFITGKNNENVEKSVKESPEHQNAGTPEASKKIKIDCKNLDCNNTINSVCGGKEEEKKWKYRIFLNECFFRKVNCAFKYAINRYKVVPMDHCKDIGGRVFPKPSVYKPYNPVRKEETRRRFSSRRTLNMGIDGAFCGHDCPEHCTEDYDPQCAVSASGQRRVFVNHCKLDYNSCLHKAVWQRRPLSECVGGKKADLRQNRGFIGWLQRVGIVDKRGRLVLS